MLRLRGLRRYAPGWHLWMSFDGTFGEIEHMSRQVFSVPISKTILLGK